MAWSFQLFVTVFRCFIVILDLQIDVMCLVKQSKSFGKYSRQIIFILGAFCSFERIEIVRIIVTNINQICDLIIRSLRQRLVQVIFCLLRDFSILSLFTTQESIFMVVFCKIFLDIRANFCSPGLVVKVGTRYLLQLCSKQR